jgi:hypothetical protein
VDRQRAPPPPPRKVNAHHGRVAILLSEHMQADQTPRRLQSHLSLVRWTMPLPSPPSQRQPPPTTKKHATPTRISKTCFLSHALLPAPLAKRITTSRMRHTASCSSDSTRYDRYPFLFPRCFLLRHCCIASHRIACHREPQHRVQTQTSLCFLVLLSAAFPYIAAYSRSSLIHND